MGRRRYGGLLNSNRFHSTESPFGRTAQYTAWFFGPFRVILDGRPRSGSGQRKNVMQLLKWFLLNPAQSVSRDDLCAMFWPGHEKESAIKCLHVSLHYLRQLLEPESSAGTQSTFICRNRDNYYWFDCRDLWWTDVLEVRSLFAAAMDADRKEEDARAISLYVQLLGYYRLTFLPEDIYEDAFASYRHEHDIAYARSLNRLMRLYLRSGQLASALSCALDAAGTDPYSHEAVKTIVQVHARQGDIAGAVGQLDDFFRTLERDMGTTPDDELVALRGALVAKQARRYPVSQSRESGLPAGDNRDKDIFNVSLLRQGRDDSGNHRNGAQAASRAWAGGCVAARVAGLNGSSSLLFKFAEDLLEFSAGNLP